jgi:hypothetical protein
MMLINIDIIIIIIINPEPASKKQVPMQHKKTKFLTNLLTKLRPIFPISPISAAFQVLIGTLLTPPGDDLQTERGSEARKRTGDALLQRCINTAFLALLLLLRLYLVLTTLSTPVLWYPVPHATTTRFLGPDSKPCVNSKTHFPLREKSLLPGFQSGSLTPASRPGAALQQHRVPRPFSSSSSSLSF